MREHIAGAGSRRDLEQAGDTRPAIYGDGETLRI
jgi:hypothetical protein